LAEVLELATLPLRPGVVTVLGAPLTGITLRLTAVPTGIWLAGILTVTGFGNGHGVKSFVD
jgi:hypothetical protein